MKHEREHVVQVGALEVYLLRQWLLQYPSSGGISLTDRVRIESVPGGGILIRVRPTRPLAETVMSTPPQAPGEIVFTQLHMGSYEGVLDVCSRCGQVLWGMNAQSVHRRQHEQSDELSAQVKKLEQRLTRLELGHPMTTRSYGSHVNYEHGYFVRAGSEEQQQEAKVNNPPDANTSDHPTVSGTDAVSEPSSEKTPDAAPKGFYDETRFEVGNEVEAVLKGTLIAFDNELGKWTLRTDGTDHVSWDIELHWAQPFRRPGELHWEHMARVRVVQDVLQRWNLWPESPEGRQRQRALVVQILSALERDSDA